MPFNPDVLTQEIRGLLGDPLVAEISDTTIESAINASLIEYSRYRPIKKPILLSVTEGVDVYVLDDGVIGVVDCTLSVSSSSVESTEEDFDAETYGVPVYGSAPNASMEQVTERYRDAVENYRGYDLEFFIGENGVPFVRFIPAPKFSGVIPMVVGLVHTATSMPTKDMELMKLYALATAMESLGNFRSKITVVPTGVGFKMNLSAGAPLLQTAKEKKAEFDRKMGVGLTWVTAG